MRVLGRLRAFTRGLFRRDDVESDFETELQFHLQRRADDLAEGGLTRAAAERQARLEFGSLQRTKEECRDALGTRLLESSLQDIRVSLRTLRKSPGFTASVVITLGLCIGVNTAIFSAVNGMLLHPLPYPNSDELMVLTEDSPAVPGMSISPPDLRDWRQLNGAFTSVAGYTTESSTLAGRGDAELLRGAAVNANLFATLATPPMLGRAFRPDEDRLGGANVAIIGDDLWKRRFGGVANIIGQTLLLDGDPFVVIGVMPPGFHFPNRQAEIWTALEPAVGRAQRGSHPGVSAIARLKPGMTVTQAQAEMTAVARRLARAYPSSNREIGALVIPLTRRVVGNSMREALLLLLGAVGLVLVIACANVANLMLSRVFAREHEFATRSSLGASSGRLLRQLATESVILSLGGGAVGVLLAALSLGAVTALLPATTPRLDEIRIDRAVLLFTLGMSLATAVALGLAPAVHLARPHLFASLRKGARGLSTGRRYQQLRRVLVVAEIALSLLLLIGAGLLLRSFENVRRTSPGLNPENVLTVQLSFSNGRYNNQDVFQRQLTAMLTRIRLLPGVGAAGAISPLPVSGENQFTSIAIEGKPLPAGEFRQCDFAIPGLGYFGTMGIPLLRGRTFEERDLRNSPPVVVIDELLARQFFPGEDPIGKRIDYGAQFDAKRARTIIGVVGHVHTYGVDATSSPVIFDLTAELPFSAVTLLVRSPADHAALLAAVRREIAAVDPTLAPFNARPMTAVIANLAAPRRLSSTLLGAFAVLAFLVAAVGTYGVISYAVAQRTQEIGIRMALGARPQSILLGVMGEGLILSAIGVVLGWAASWAFGRVIVGQLFHVGAADPVTYLGAALLAATMAATAAYLPARRGLRVDPTLALRGE